MRGVYVSVQVGRGLLSAPLTVHIMLFLKYILFSSVYVFKFLFIPKYNLLKMSFKFWKKLFLLVTGNESIHNSANDHCMVNSNKLSKEVNYGNKDLFWCPKNSSLLLFDSSCWVVQRIENWREWTVILLTQMLICNKMRIFFLIIDTLSGFLACLAGAKLA